MKHRIFVFALALVATMSWADAGQAVGYWKSVSDVKGEEGKVTALWKLSLDPTGALQGVIVWSPRSDATTVYVSKKAEYNGKPVQGTVWMKGLKRTGDEWKGGTIVDIGNDKGEVYGCEVKVIEGGKKLAMRGYVGIALIGRTQTWVAAGDDEVKKLLGQ